MTRCFLYWAPVTSFPVPFGQREWFKRFFDLFLDSLENQLKLRTEVFLTYRAALDFGDSFMKAAQDIPPLMGLSIRPGAGPTGLPSTEEIKRTIEDGKEFNMKDWIGDYCYWFVKKTPRKYLELFGGHGGLRMMLLKPDPEATPPSIKIPPSSSMSTHCWQAPLRCATAF